jgi:hypothetical protein
VYGDFVDAAAYVPQLSAHDALARGDSKAWLKAVANGGHKPELPAAPPRRVLEGVRSKAWRAPVRSPLLPLSLSSSFSLSLSHTRALSLSLSLRRRLLLPYKHKIGFYLFSPTGLVESTRLLRPNLWGACRRAV